MGWIAEALKKADEERATVLGPPRSHPHRTGPIGPTDDLFQDRPEDSAAPPPGPPATEDVRPPDADLPRAAERPDHSLVVLHGQEPVLTEQYRTLRTRLLSQNTRAHSQMIAVTSSLPGEGKSVTTSNLGIVLAEVKHLHVLLVDADFRRSSLARLFGLKPHPGLVEVLQGQADIDQVVQRTIVENLDLMPAGLTDGVNPAELLSSKRAAAVFDELRDRYGYVLADTPPCVDVADAGIVGQLADGMLMILRLGKTPQPLAKRIVQMLQASRVNLIGCVLIGSEEASFPYGYDDYGYSGRDHHR